MAAAQATDGGQPWRDKQTLERLYWDEGLHQGEVAQRLGCSRRTVSVWMNKLGIETRKGHPVVPWVNFRTDRYGYEQWQNMTPPDKGELMFVHRLLAIAEYGPEAVKDKHVHHKNGIKWDNRPENIELLTPGEHTSHHLRQLDYSGSRNPNSKLTEEDVRAIRDSRETHTAEELAERFGVSTSHINSIWNRRVWKEIEGTQANHQ